MHAFRRPQCLLRPAGGLLEQPVRRDADGDDRVPSPDLERAPGETVVIQSAHNGDRDICQFALSPYLYAKIAVDSVSLATRTLYLRLGLDPNCGFRSFASGIPTS